MQQSHGARGAPGKKRSWINPRRHSQMLSNSKIAVFIRRLVFRSKIPAARPMILLMPCSCFTSVKEGCRVNSTSPGRPDSGISLPSLVQRLNFLKSSPGRSCTPLPKTRFLLRSNAHRGRLTDRLPSSGWLICCSLCLRTSGEKRGDDENSCQNHRGGGGQPPLHRC